MPGVSVIDFFLTFPVLRCICCCCFLLHAPLVPAKWEADFHSLLCYSDLLFYPSSSLIRTTRTLSLAMFYLRQQGQFVLCFCFCSISLFLISDSPRRSYMSISFVFFDLFFVTSTLFFLFFSFMAFFAVLCTIAQWAGNFSRFNDYQFGFNYQLEVSSIHLIQ